MNQLRVAHPLILQQKGQWPPDPGEILVWEVWLAVGVVKMRCGVNLKTTQLHYLENFQAEHIWAE
jgi:hypothetical protein